MIRNINLIEKKLLWKLERARRIKGLGERDEDERERER